MSTMVSNLELIRRVPLFSMLTASQAESVAEAVVKSRFKNTLSFAQGVVVPKVKVLSVRRIRQCISWHGEHTQNQPRQGAHNNNPRPEFAVESNTTVRQELHRHKVQTPSDQRNERRKKSPFKNSSWIGLQHQYQRIGNDASAKACDHGRNVAAGRTTKHVTHHGGIDAVNDGKRTKRRLPSAQ